MQHSPREGPRIWMEVKYGSAEGLKKLLKVCTLEEVSAPGGRDLTSPVHEAVSRVDLQMVDMLRYKLCDMDYEIAFGACRGKNALSYALLLNTRRPSVANDIFFSLSREALHRPKREENRALYALMCKNRIQMLTFANVRHERLGNAANSMLHNASDDVMRLIFDQMNDDV
jgi:hypothetical protein